jgi:type IV pilus assembly protein PilY1
MKASNYCLKAASVALSVVCVLVLAGQPASAETCDFPLPIQRTMANGNVLFVLDSSGSMNEILHHLDYNINITYDGPFQAATLYGVKQDGFYGPSDFNRNLADEPQIYLVNSDNSYEGLYAGNYLNWLYYHATPEQIATMPLLTRIQAEKAVMHEILDEFNPDGSPTGTLRFGFFTFNASGAGGNLMSKIGSPREVMLNAVDGVSAKGSTPLAETLVDVIDYLSLTGNLAPIEYTCQKTFVVLLTDGYPTNDLDVPSYIGDWDGDGREPGNCTSIGAPYDNWQNCSDYVDDVAGYMNELDMRPDMDEVQNAATYVVGFNIDAPLLAQTAANGDGLYMTARSVEELKRALVKVLRDIIRRISSGSAVAIVSVEGETEDHLLRAKYLPEKWQGFLEAFALPYGDGDQPIWEAGDILADRSSDSRLIYTTLDGQQIEFDDSYADHLQGAMGLATTEETVDVINWTRGEEIPGLRYRAGWKLGDIVDSSPVVVGAPSSFLLDDQYMSFRQAHADRARIVYIGGNDAMVHAFDEMTGNEEWAFIPESHLPRLKDMADTTYCHEYFVNLTPKAQDVYMSGEWRTVLFCGMRQGGDAFFTIDVTDPESPQFLWETEIPEIVESWTQPEIVRLNGFDHSVAIVGSGPDYVTGDARVMMINVDDGSLMWSEELSNRADVNMATAAEAVDIDYDGYEDLFYISDLAGHLWRYDLSTFPPQRSLLFETDQPIQAEPILTVDYNNDVFIYFGTGKYIDSIDFIDESINTFYCVIDNHSLTTVDRYSMVDQTNTISPISANSRGWYIDLLMGPGERIVEPDALVAGVVYFTSFKPMSEQCEFGGFSWLYGVDFRNGAAVDGNDDPGDDTTDGRVEEIGEGIVSKPVVDIINEDVVIQGSDTRIHVRDTQGIIQQLIVRSWRQLYN